MTAAVALLAAAAVSSVSAQEGLGVGLDLDVSGNSATTVSQIDSCVAVEPGSAFSIDVFVQNVPARLDADGGSGGIAGFSYNLLFDPDVVEVTSVDTEYMLASTGDFHPFEFIDADAANGPDPDSLPATTGNLRVDLGDLSTDYEEGNGVLSRLELLAKGAGETSLWIVDVIDQRASPSLLGGAPTNFAYPVATVYNALVVVGGSCGAEPTPYVQRDGGGPGTIGDLPGAPTLAPSSDGEPTPASGAPAGSTQLAIDVLPAGNKATEIDAIEDCAAADVGDIFLVDIVIEDVKELLSWEIALSYDPEVLSVTDRDVMVFQDANSGSSVIDLSAATPDTSGRYVLAAVDSADPPTRDSGSGVLAQVTMMAIDEGTSPVTIEKLDLDGDGDFDQGVFLRNVAGEIIGDDEGADTLFDGPTEGAEIRVGGECPGSPDAKVQLVSDDGQNGSTGADDDDGTSLLLIIILVLAAVVVLGGGAAYFVRRRSG